MNSMNVAAYKKLKHIHTNIKFTLYLPIDPGPEHTIANTTQFNNAIATLKRVFKDTDILPKNQRKIIENLRSQTIHFTNGFSGKGVAVFICSNNHAELYSLPFRPKASLYYGLQNIHLEPLEKHFGHTATFWVLTVSAQGCHLFKGNGRTFTPINDKQLQTDMITALHLDETNLAGVQNHTTNEGGVKGSEGFHGHGGFKDIRKKYMQDYFRIIDSRLKMYVKNASEPVILVGVDYVQSLYKKATHNKLAKVSKISLDPHAFSIANLRQFTEPLAQRIAKPV